jgi:hypothetical protein
MWLRQKIAGLLAWLGMVTLLLTFSVMGIAVAAYVLSWLKTGEWPATFRLGQPLKETLRDAGIEAPSSSWIILQQTLSWILNQPTWIVAFFGAGVLGLLLMSWGDTLERSIQRELRHRKLRGE